MKDINSDGVNSKSEKAPKISIITQRHEDNTQVIIIRAAS